MKSGSPFSGIRVRVEEYPRWRAVLWFLYLWVLPVPIFFLVTIPLVLAALVFRVLVAPLVSAPRSSVRKILVVVPDFDRVGGYESQARALSSRLARRGNEVVILTNRLDGCAGLFSAEGAHITRIGNIPPYPRSFITAFNPTVCAFLRRPSYRTVHIHAIFSRLSASAVLAAALTGKRAIARIATEGDIVECRNHPDLEFRWYFHTAKLLDRIVALSRRILDECVEQGLPQQKIEIISNGVDTERFSPADEAARKEARQGLALPAGPLALYVGRFEKRKGLDFLLRNWKVVTERTGAALILVGDGPEREALLELAAREGLGQTIRIVGLVSDVKPFLAACDLFVFPSRREGVPNAVLEAMAAGLPVLATRIGGIEELICSGENGVLVEPDCDRELVEEAAALLLDRERRARLGKAAREFVCRNRSLDAVAAEYELLYDSLPGKEGLS
jgi:glycosyltransferase involved in cell wall biosynthesis